MRFLRDYFYRRLTTVGPVPAVNFASSERLSSLAVMRVAVLIIVARVRCETSFDDIKWSSFVKEVVFRVKGRREVCIE
jgi:hypothetical protein